MVLAAADDGEMDGVWNIAVSIQQLRQGLHLLEGNVDGAPAHFAHEMVMVLLGHMDHARSLPEMDVVGDPRFLKGVDGSVHRGQVDVRSQLGLGSLLEIQGGRMPMLGVRQNSANRPTRGGDPHPGPT